MNEEIEERGMDAFIELGRILVVLVKVLGGLTLLSAAVAAAWFEVKHENH